MSTKVSVVALLTLASGITADGADWPQFRGPWSNGHAAAPGATRPLGLPVQWSETENVRWKTAIPHVGWSSPVVLEGKIWLTTATEKGNDFFVICVNAASGEVLLNQRLFHSDTPEPLGNPVNAYASPTPVVESGRVYVHFGSYGTACLDTQTFQVLWKREDLPCRHYRGPGSSPALFQNTLLLTMDGIDQQYLVALDKFDGSTVWRTDRNTEFNDLDRNGRPTAGGDLRKGFTTPLIMELGGRMQLISPGSKAAYSYDPSTGKELWKLRYPGHTPAVSVIAGNGLIYFATGWSPSELLAVRPTGVGDVTDTHIVWKSNRGVPQKPSPVMVDQFLYVVADTGVLTCFDAVTGKELWQERVGSEVNASLLYADGCIFCFDTDGIATVIKAGSAFELIRKNRLAAGFMASPAVIGKAFILRTKSHLYRIENQESR